MKTVVRSIVWGAVWAAAAMLPWSAAAQELTLEIDREIINDLFLASTGTQGVFSRTAPMGITELDHLRSLLTTMSEVSNTIHQKTLRAPANWCVVSPTISALTSYSRSASASS